MGLMLLNITGFCQWGKAVIILGNAGADAVGGIMKLQWILGLLLLGFTFGAHAEEKTIKGTVKKKAPVTRVDDSAPKAKEDSSDSTASTDSTDSGESSSTHMICKNGAQARHLEITSQDPNSDVPCEVHYRKETEQPGHDQVLWTAQNDAQYCKDKATAFVAKLEGWGWSCASK
jgi:hypothetical protein